MSPADSADQVVAPAAELVAISQINPPVISARQGPLDQRHVRALQEVLDLVPPVTVHRQNMTLVDGAHRIEAMRQAGGTEIRVVYFDGTAMDAFVLAIQANATHGRPLTLEERKGAARVLLAQFPDRSTRWISVVCGLSSATVARIRPRTDAPERRVGQDGRSRPVDPSGVWTAIAERLDADPEASLRQVATDVGASPSTVRRIAGQRSGSLPVDGKRATPKPPARPTLVAEPFTRWMVATEVDDERAVGLIADLAPPLLEAAAAKLRQRSQYWAKLAEVVEERIRPDAE